MYEDWQNINIKASKSQSDHPSDFQHKIRINKNNKYVNSQGRLVNTKEYAIAWGVINKPYSTSDLYNKCKNDPQAPSYVFITKRCWKGYPRYYDDLVKAGMQPRPPRTDRQRRQIIAKAAKNGFKLGLLDKDIDAIRIAAEYGAIRRSDYNKLRKQHPQLKVFLPSYHAIEVRFGNWSRFSYEVMKYNTDVVVNQYVKKSAQCGHWLKLSECDKLKIPIRGIMDILRPTIFNALCYKKLALMNKKI